MRRNFQISRHTLNLVYLHLFTFLILFILHLLIYLLIHLSVYLNFLPFNSLLMCLSKIFLIYMCSYMYVCADAHMHVFIYLYLSNKLPKIYLLNKNLLTLFSTYFFTYLLTYFQLPIYFLYNLLTFFSLI